MTEPDEADWKTARHLAAVSSWAAKDVEAIATIIATAKAEERSAVVAWLRERHADTQEWDGFNDLYDNAVSCTYRRAADNIERGKHRREEGA